MIPSPFPIGAGVQEIPENNEINNDAKDDDDDEI